MAFLRELVFSKDSVVTPLIEYAVLTGGGSSRWIPI
jgi:hypothetical protein